MIAVFDGCVLIDHLRGVGAARDALLDVDERRVSALTVAELRLAVDQRDANLTRRPSGGPLDELLAACTVVPVDVAIAELAGRIASSTGLPLWDATVLATARRDGLRLITRHAGYGVEAYDVEVAYDPADAVPLLDRIQRQ